jgi:hypothetical protein
MRDTIRLTDIGDAIDSLAGKDRAAINRIDITSEVGFHNLCGGIVLAKVVSTSHRVLYCTTCCLRVPIPESIKTWGALRTYFGRKFCPGVHITCAKCGDHDVEQGKPCRVGGSGHDVGPSPCHPSYHE